MRRDDPHAQSKVHVAGIIFKLVATYLAIMLVGRVPLSSC